MTKNVSIELAKKHMSVMGIRFESGRAESAAQLHNVIVDKDRWERNHGDTRQHEAIVTRIHDEERRELFTPSGEGCPARLGELAALRRTVGKTASGKTFEIEDSWRRPERAHRELEENWTGRTEFFPRASSRS